MIFSLADVGQVKELLSKESTVHLAGSEVTSPGSLWFYRAPHPGQALSCLDDFSHYFFGPSSREWVGVEVGHQDDF